MSYQISGIRLIPQDRDNACWYASAQMVVQWRRNSTLMTEAGLLDPSEEPESVRLHRANNVIPWVQIRRFAQDIGLRPLPLMTPTEETLESWMRSYGPIWTDGVPVSESGAVVGTGHVVVIAGIDRDVRPSRILIYDPWPPNHGNKSWRPISHLAGILSDSANRGRDTFFLRCPG